MYLFKKAISLIVSATMIFSILPTQAASASEEPVSDSRQEEINPIKIRGGYEAPPFDTSNLQRSGKRQLRGEFRAKTLPKSFRLFKGESDSADEISPKLKDQSDWGVCWTFSALGSAESSLYSNSLNDFEFSERHLAYFTYHGTNNPNAPEDGTAGDTYVSSNPFEGGTFFKAIATLSRGTGVAWDKDVPYPTPSDFKSGKDKDFETVDEKYHYDSHFQLREVNFLPNQDASGNLDGSAIKNALESGTSVSCTYYSRADNASTYYTAVDGLKYPVYFCSSKATADHAVQIVGWDDSIPAADFTDGGSHPSKPGAWIIKNSWGAANAYRGGAYFYISYEDKTLTQFCTFSMDAKEDSPRYAHNYQYDGDGEVSQTGDAAQPAKAANVFSPTGNQNLDAIAFYTTDADAKYSIQVYTNVTGDSPESGIKAFDTEQTGQEAYPGYHTVPLDTSVPLKSGQKFSVVISIENPYHKANPIAVECNSVNQYRQRYSSVGIKKGQSYLFNGASWQDMSLTRYGNICLKAFTNDSGKEPSGSILVTPASAKVAMGESQTFSASVTGMADDRVKWSVSGSTSRDTGIDSTGKLTVALDETAPVLTVKAECVADASVSATVRVTVLPPKEIPGITVTPASAKVAMGESQTFAASVTGMADDRIKWSVSGNTSRDTGIDPTGKLTVALDETAPFLTVKAECVTNASVSATVRVTVLPSKGIPGITVTPASAQVMRGQYRFFLASVMGMDNKNVKWSVTGNASKETTISGIGKLSIALNETSPVVIIRAESVVDSSVFAQAKVFVLPPSENQKIISFFDFLNPDVRYQTVVNGTAVSALNLPEKINATVNGGEHKSVGVAGWVSDPPFNPSADGIYSFIPVIGSEYVLLSGTVLPKIAVTVTHNIPHSHGGSGSHSGGGSGGGRSTGNEIPPVNNNNPGSLPQPTQPNTDGAVQIAVSAAVNTKPSVVNRVAEINASSEFDISFAAQHATAQKHSEIDVSLPSAEIIGQLKSSETNSVNLTVKMISSPVYTVSNVDFVMNLDPTVLQAAKQSQKDLTVRLVDDQTGKENYSWSFKGSDLANAEAVPAAINLALSIKKTASDTAVSTAISTDVSGALVTFANQGILPAPATIRTFVGSQGFVSGQILYLYYYNPGLKRLETVDYPVCKVDSDGYASLVITHCSQYVLLPQQVPAVKALKLDTGKHISVRSGSTYTFKITAPARPTFVSGNSSVFKVVFAGCKGSDYFYKVIAVGKSKSSTGFYVNNERIPRTVATIG